MTRWIAVVALLSVFASAAWAQEAAVPAGALARMPVKEVTVFKDGHAYLLHEGDLPTDADGNVVMDYLPRPVMGTFWPYVRDTKAKLAGVVAGKRRMAIRRTALSIRELLEANVGTDVVITESNNVTYDARILGIPARSAEELEATSPPGAAKALPQKGNLILLKTMKGVEAIPIGDVKHVTFKDAPKDKSTQEELRNLLTLKIDWGARKRAKTVRAGLVYVERGIRWIPNYRVDIDGNGKAVLKLQATLLNEMTDLEDVTAHLVVGVPTFQFKDTVDPISMQRAVAQLSQHFQPNTQAAYAFSNMIMTQAAAPVQVRRSARAAGGGMDLGPNVPGGKQEDLFIFTVKNITLKKGERMVLPVVEFPLEYRDVYVLDIPFAPPQEMRKRFNSNQQRELAKLFHAPKVQHVIRLTNKSRYPLTTAPALILREGRILGQGMMTYTAAGAAVDLNITTAIDVWVKRSAAVVKRTPNAQRWHGNNYDRFDMAAKVELANHLKKDIDLEVVVRVLGTIDGADKDGKTTQLSRFQEHAEWPHWWHWYSWPYWWSHFNGIGTVTWKQTLKSGDAVDLNYTWHYFWRY